MKGQIYEKNHHLNVPTCFRKSFQPIPHLFDYLSQLDETLPMNTSSISFHFPLLNSEGGRGSKRIHKTIRIEEERERREENLG